MPSFPSLVNAVHIFIIARPVNLQIIGTRDHKPIGIRHSVFERIAEKRFKIGDIRDFVYTVSRVPRIFLFAADFSIRYARG